MESTSRIFQFFLWSSRFIFGNAPPHLFFFFFLQYLKNMQISWAGAYFGKDPVLRHYPTDKLSQLCILQKLKPFQMAELVTPPILRFWSNLFTCQSWSPLPVLPFWVNVFTWQNWAPLPILVQEKAGGKFYHLTYYSILGVRGFGQSCPFSHPQVRGQAERAACPPAPALSRRTKKKGFVCTDTP